MRRLSFQRLIASALLLLSGATRAAQAQPALILSQVSGAAGSRVSFTGSLAADGVDVAAVQGDIGFDPLAIPLAGLEFGNPLCALNPGLGRTGVFALQPPRCMNTECTAIRVAVIPTFPITALPQVTNLFTCDIDIAASATPAIYPLSLSRVVFSDLEGRAISGGVGVDGSVEVSAAATPTPTPPPCTGDCNGDGEVPINELITMVNIGLGNSPLSLCTAGDRNGDGEVTIDEILRAVNAALGDC